jgi:hypothetical protein
MSVDDNRNTSGDGTERPEPPKPTLRRRWRYFSRRHAFLAGLIIGVGILALLIVALLAYRFGYVDRYVASQITNTFANYGIRATIREFHSSIPPHTVEMSGIELYDAATGEQLGKIDRLAATIRISDLYALNLRRNINLEDLKIEGFEAWVKFDEEGRSNFRNVHIPPPAPNARILFAYSTAHIEIKNGVVHYGDLKHELSGEARNLKATIQPDDPSQPVESRMNTIVFGMTDSTFTYDGRPVNKIDVDARARINQTRAEIQELTLKSPLAEAHLSGTMDDWRALRYQLNITSSVDLTQVSDTFQTDATLRGIGNFSGTVTGEGDQFKVQGGIKSDALAADGLRLQGLKVTTTGSVNGKSYEINGKAVADLLTSGDFEIDSLQIAGNVMGTGTNFRWIGELRAIAEKSYGTTMTGLILRDARADMNDGVLTASASQFTANGFSGSGAKVNGITASGLKVKNQNKVTTASVATVKAGNISASGATVKGVTASDIDVNDRDGVTSVVVKNVQIGATSAGGAEIGELNIAGVKLSVRNRRVEGSTADIDVGNVKYADGQAENVKLSKPVFVVEPSGSYRATADLSIGGGVLGKMKMGQASAKVVATSRDIQLNDFNAEVFKGRANGSAKISLVKNGASQVVAKFDGLDIAGPLTAMAGSPVPLTGRATGNVDLTFPGMDFKLASGTLTTQLRAEAGETSADRIPITGDVAVRADRGVFNIQQVNLQTPATTLKASGVFSFENDSNLQVDLNSTDAAELQTVLISSGLLPDVEEQLHTYGIGLAGQLAFNGNIRGKLKDPDVNGTFSLGSLSVNGNELGALSATVAMNATDLRVSNGQLIERDGGGAKFSLVKPRTGENNTSFEATLDKANAGVLSSLLATLPGGGGNATTPGSSVDAGRCFRGYQISGIPNAMVGSADLSLGPGKISGEQLESMTARATFSGSNVNIESIDVHLAAGRIVGSGNLNTSTKAFDFQGKAEGVELSRLTALSKKPGMPVVTGVADFTAHVVGNLMENDFSNYQVTFDGTGRDVTINGRPAGAIALVGRTENKQLSITLTSGILGSPQVVAAQINLASERLAASVETTLTNADLTNLFSILIPNNKVRVSGRANGTIKASGDLLDDDNNYTWAGLTGTATFSELTFRAEDVQLTATTALIVRFWPGEAVFDGARFTGQGTNITLDGTVATASNGSQNLNINGSLNLRVLNGVSPDFFSTGTAEVAVRVSGTFEDPRLIGTASLAGASVSVLLKNERWTVSNLTTVVRFTSNQAQIDSLTGTLGGGRVNATGGALLDGLTVSGFRLNLRADDVTVPFPQDFRSTLDADVEIKGSSREQLISGQVNLRRTEYTQDIEVADLINSTRAESIEEGAEIELTRTAVFAALRVEGRNALVVHNNLADLTGSVSLQLDGPVNDPTISGRITSTNGTLNFRNDRYDVTRALVDLPPTRNADRCSIFRRISVKGYRVIFFTGPLSAAGNSSTGQPYPC